MAMTVITYFETRQTFLMESKSRKEKICSRRCTYAGEVSTGDTFFSGLLDIFLLCKYLLFKFPMFELVRKYS